MASTMSTGIDTTVFTPHSVRRATTSAARLVVYPWLQLLKLLVGVLPVHFVNISRNLLNLDSPRVSSIRDREWNCWITLRLTSVVVVVVSQFNGTSTPKGSYIAKTGDNDCNVNSSRYNLRTALCESIRYQAKSEQNVRQDLIPRIRNSCLVLCYKLRFSLHCHVLDCLLQV